MLMRKVFGIILNGITKMLRCVKALGGMEVRQIKMLIRRYGIVIPPSTKNNDSIYALRK